MSAFLMTAFELVMCAVGQLGLLQMAKQGLLQCFCVYSFDARTMYAPMDVY